MLECRRVSDPRHRIAGGYILSPGAVSIMRNGPISSDLFARLRRQGGQIEERDVAGCLACDGDASGLLEANRLALSHIEPDVSPVCLDSSEIQGDVVVHPSARLKNSLVRGPAIIGPHCRLVNAYVGPYTSVGARVCIEGSEIEYSIVMDDARLMFVGSRLETSIIGRAAEIVRRFEMPSAVRMSVGDGAQVALS
jgi:glucose-1-phosphate thymidylyltransferase